MDTLNLTRPARHRRTRRPVWALMLATTALLTIPVTTPAVAGPQSDCETVLSAARLGSTRVSVMVRDLNTGAVVVEIEADAPRVPASNMKLLTTAAALDRLGADFRFSTRLEEVPTPEALRSDDGSGVSLRVVGDGDPGFGDPTLLATAGHDVRELVGLWTAAAAARLTASGHAGYDRLLIDDRVLDREWTHPEWPGDQLNYYYCAQVAGLNFHENLMSVVPTPAPKKGATPSIAVYPRFRGLDTTNRAKTGDSDVFDIRRRAGTNRFSFNGTVRRKRHAPYRITVHDPPMFFASYFRDELQRAGVAVGPAVRVDASLGDDDPGAARSSTPGLLLHTVRTTLAGVLDRTNQDSQNMFAEALFKRLGHQLTGEPGSFTHGAAAVRTFLRDRLSARTGLAGVVVSDGSGMSPKNRVTARVVTSLLTELHGDPELGPVFVASLAHGGYSGSLRSRRDKLRTLTGSVYAKSGYLGKSADYASSLSGYLVAPDGRAWAFSFLFNGFRPPLSNATIKRVQNDMLAALDAKLVSAPAAGR